MTLDWQWVQQNWVFLACVAGAAYFYLAKSGNPLAGYKLPPIPVRIVPDDQPKG